MKRIAWIGIVCLLAAQAAGGDYFVSLTGNDGNPGTQDQPFRTFRTAIAKANGGDTVRIKGGVYQEPLVVSKSCTDPLVIKPVGNEIVIIRNTAELPPEFVMDQGVYSIDFETDVRGIVWDIRNDPLVVAFICRAGNRAQMAQEGGYYFFDPSKLKLYLKPENRADGPNQHQLTATFIDTGVTISGKNIIVEGLTIELAGANGVYVGNAENVTVRRCRVVGMASQWSFCYTVDAASRVTIEESTGSRAFGAVTINSSRDVAIRHCAFYRTRNHGIMFSGTNRAVRVTDNILYVNKIGGYMYYMAGKPADSVIDYNCGLACDRPLLQFGAFYAGEQLTSLDAVRAKTGFDEHSICADPKFLSEKCDSENLMTAGDGPCRNKGSDGRTIGLTEGGGQ